MSALRAAIEAKRASHRLWFYANYHCNLECTYCLTESSPRAPRRMIDAALMRTHAQRAAELGFTELGITGGEPFLRPDLPELLVDMSRHLPVTVLTNGTQFHGERIKALTPLVGCDISIQISLDAADPDINDMARGPENFRKVTEAIPRLLAMGLRVRIASTGQAANDLEQERLCELHRSMGISDDDHVVRPIVNRGRGATVSGAVPAGKDDLFPELTITTDGAFWSPFAPTVIADRVDIDLLVSRTVAPLDVPVSRFVALVDDQPEGTDVTYNIR